MFTLSPRLSTSERAALRNAAFALETVAHLRGLERDLLPIAEILRTIERQANSITTEGPINAHLT